VIKGIELNSIKLLNIYIYIFKFFYKIFISLFILSYTQFYNKSENKLCKSYKLIIFNLKAFETIIHKTLTCCFSKNLVIFSQDGIFWSKKNFITQSLMFVIFVCFQWLLFLYIQILFFNTFFKIDTFKKIEYSL